MKTRKAILYVRVSTDEQADGFSLSYQEERLRKYCALNNIEVAAFYKEDHSAKTFERPEFKKLLAFLKSNKHSADLLLFLKWDRFSRNAADAYGMISQLNKLGVEPQAIEQPLDMNIPEHKFMLAIYLAAPEVENDRRSLNISDGIHKAMKEGRWMGPAPVGYKRSRDENNKACIIPSEKASLVQWVFEEMATGLHHIDHLRMLAHKKGLKTKRSAFHEMFRNPAYIGKIRVPAYKVDPAMIVEAKHEPIIATKLFYDVQDILEGKRKKNNQPAKHTQREELPLRGFLTCPRCNRILTGSGSKGNGGRYFYYHCRTGCKERFLAADANASFYGQLTAIANNEKLFKSMELILKEANQTDGQDKATAFKKLKQELEVYQKRLENAQLLMLDGGIDAADYRNIKSRIEPEIERLARQIASFEQKDPEEEKINEYGFFFLRHLNVLIDFATPEEKFQFLGSTFPEKFHFKDGKVRTNSDNAIVKALFTPDAAFTKIKNGSETLFSLPSGGVENTGVEPVTSCMPCKRSSQLS